MSGDLRDLHSQLFTTQARKHHVPTTTYSATSQHPQAQNAAAPYNATSTPFNLPSMPPSGFPDFSFMESIITPQNCGHFQLNPFPANAESFPLSHSGGQPQFFNGFPAPTMPVVHPEQLAIQYVQAYKPFPGRNPESTFRCDTDRETFGNSTSLPIVPSLALPPTTTPAQLLLSDLTSPYNSSPASPYPSLTGVDDSYHVSQPHGGLDSLQTDLSTGMSAIHHAGPIRTKKGVKKTRTTVALPSNRNPCRRCRKSHVRCTIVVEIPNRLCTGCSKRRLTKCA